MKLVDWLLSLYPRVWRTRYGEEFRALLEEHKLSFFDVSDIIWGACDARFSPQFHAHDVLGAFTMQGKRALQIAGGGALLCAILFSISLLNRTEQGWFDGGLMVSGQFLMVPVSILLHIACRQRDARRSNRIFLLTLGCLIIGIAIFMLLRQQPNGDLTLGWQNIYLGGTFGLWIALNSRIAHATGLLPHWGMSLGVVSGVLWFIITLVMLGIGLHPTDMIWFILIFAVAAIWLAAQWLWVFSLALSAFLPDRIRGQIA